MSDETKRLINAYGSAQSCTFTREQDDWDRAADARKALDEHLEKLEAIAHAALDAVMHSHMAACDCGVCAAIRAYGDS